MIYRARPLINKENRTMKTLSILKTNLNEDTPATSVQQTSAAKPKGPLDAHEVLDFYKSHSEEIGSMLRTMKTTNRLQQMFMLGYYIGNSKR